MSKAASTQLNDFISWGASRSGMTKCHYPQYNELAKECSGTFDVQYVYTAPVECPASRLREDRQPKNFLPRPATTRTL